MGKRHVCGAVTNSPHPNLIKSIAEQNALARRVIRKSLKDITQLKLSEPTKDIVTLVVESCLDITTNLHVTHVSKIRRN